jgi:hypothetical protein
MAFVNGLVFLCNGKSAAVTSVLVIVTHYGGPDALLVVEGLCPEPQQGEVRVRMLAARVSMPDIMAREGVQAETPRDVVVHCRGAMAGSLLSFHVGKRNNNNEQGTCMAYSCKCPCGSTAFEVHGEPITRFYCHCTICQKQYDAPYVDVTLFKLNEVVLPEDHRIQFHRFKRFGAVDRGRCPECDKPILSKLGEGEKGFAFVAARNYVDANALPPAEMHVFYGTRVADVDDDLPKYNNAITSRVAFIRRMTGRGSKPTA